MVFCNTRRTTDFVANNLKSAGLNTLAIHGGFSQDKRNKTMENFHSQDVSVLACTDVAARGLDIKGVTHVYNYDIPKDGKEYIHRIGRTARAGKEGKAISLLSEKDHDNFSRVLRDNDIEVREERRPHVERVQVKWTGERRSFSRGPPRYGHGYDSRASSPRDRQRRRY